MTADDTASAPAPVSRSPTAPAWFRRALAVPFDAAALASRRRLAPEEPDACCTRGRGGEPMRLGCEG